MVHSARFRGRPRQAMVAAAAGAVLAGAAHRAAHRAVLAARTAPDPDVLALPAVPVVPECREHRVRTADGVTLHVGDYGDPASDVTVVLAHGWTLSSELWARQIAILAERARVVVYDHRGHGRSERAPATACTLAQLGSDLGTVIDAVAPTGDLVLAGHSMGGMTIMHLAEQRPELFEGRVRGVALVSTSAGELADLDLGLPAPAAALVRRFGAPAMARVARLERLVEGRQTPPAMWLGLRHLNFGPGAPARLVDEMNKVTARTPLGMVSAFYAALLAHDGTPGLPVLVRLPVVIVVGDQDRLTPPAHAQRLAAALPSARLVVVPGAGHMVILERPGVVASAVEGLLEDRRDALRLPAQASAGAGRPA